MKLTNKKGGLELDPRNFGSRSYALSHNNKNNVQKVKAKLSERHNFSHSGSIKN